MATVQGVAERELKLGMEIGADLPDLRQVVAASVRQPDQVLQAVYYDTPDMRLWGRGITLRHRDGEEVSRWTLKLPHSSSADQMVRTELEWTAGDEHVPQEAVEIVAGIVRRASLQKVVQLNTERTRFHLEDQSGVWAELASDVVTIVGGGNDGKRFRQLELEITPGVTVHDNEVIAVAKVLRRAGAHRDPHPKLEKALGPSEAGPAIGAKSSVEEVVRHAISAGLGRLMDHDCRIRAAREDVGPEDVHQARVATRRLRSDLGTLTALLDPVWVGHVRADLRSLGTVLGAVRDIDVLTETLTDAGANDQLIRTLGHERKSAVDDLRHALNERRYLDLLDRLHAASASPPIIDRRRARRSARRVLPPLVGRRWKKLRADVRKGGRRPSDDRLHQIRKRSKQLRYASELAALVIGKSANRTAKASKALQTVLGDYHDTVTATEWLTRASHGRGVDDLLVDQRQRGQKLSRTWPPLYQQLTKSPRQAWMKNEA